MTDLFDAFPLVLAQADGDKPVKSAPAPAKDSNTATTGADGSKANGGGGAANPVPKPGMGMDLMLFIFIGFFVLLIFFQMRSQKKEKKSREAMLGALKKGDKVQTIGGILGTVLEVRPDRVVLKTDENNNTKTTFARSAIQVIINESDAPRPEPEVSKDGSSS